MAELIGMYELDARVGVKRRGQNVALLGRPEQQRDLDPLILVSVWLTD